LEAFEDKIKMKFKTLRELV